MNKQVLYISYDGLSDPLGQSQIIPYLCGLAGLGHVITVLSCEKSDKVRSQKDQILRKLSEKNIHWEYVIFKNSPPGISTLLNFNALSRKANSLQQKHRFSLIHCRSYLAAMIGLALKKRFGTKLIFDMRGFWADERVEGGLWDLRNPIYRWAYSYFKRKETELLSRADLTVALTEKGKKIIHSWKQVQGQPIPIEVIPCCADTGHFSRESIEPERSAALKRELGIGENELVLSYLGSTGTWYCLGEMLGFFKCLLRTRPDSKFLFITQDNPHMILAAAGKQGVPANKLIVQPATYSSVPLFLSLSSVSVFFIKPSYSKNASSPTKLAETLSMGIPVICNSGIGDTDDIVLNGNCGILIPGFREEDYQKAVQKLDQALQSSPAEIRAYSKNHFSLQAGVSRYNAAYCRLLA